MQRSAIIRLSSNGKAGVEFKINCNANYKMAQFSFPTALQRTEVREPVLFVLLPSPSPELGSWFQWILKIQSSSHFLHGVFQDCSHSWLQTSWHSPKQYQRIGVRSWDCDVRPAGVDPQSDSWWPGALPLWASFLWKTGTKRVTGRMKWGDAGNEIMSDEKQALINVSYY